MRSKVPEFPKPINPVYKRSVRCASVSTSKKWYESFANCSKTDFHNINSLKVIYQIDCACVSAAFDGF